MRAAAVALAVLLVAVPSAGAARRPDLARYVNPFVGTDSGAPDFGTGGGAGNTFPGAVVPFGMVQFSPDSYPSRLNFAGGYSYPDKQLRGFGLTHFSGAGCAAYQDVPFLPTTAPVDRSPAVTRSSDIEPQYLAGFDHKHESASPGAYSVTLNPGSKQPIRTDLTATTRTGLARFGFPATKAASVLVNTGGSAMANGDAQAHVDPARREISGMSESGRFCYATDSYRVYFAARFSRPFSAFGTWQRQDLHAGATDAADHSDGPLNYQPVPGGPASVPGNPSGTAQAGAYATFDTSRQRNVQVRVGVSFTSVADARRNLDAEARRGSFTSLRDRARRLWNSAFMHAQVTGGGPTWLRLYYTALYHSLLHPNVFSNVDGSYAGMDGKRRVAVPGRVQYANWSGWDVYRGQQQLVAMLFPKRAGDMAQSLVAAAQEAGCLPRWSLANGNTNAMVGDPADPILASAWAFGARFDGRAALGAMVRGATQPCHTDNGDVTEREALDDYLRQGYIGHERNADVTTHALVHTAPWGSAATTLEYANADFAISRLAAALGDQKTASDLLARSANWRKLFNPSTRTIEPRYSTGLWVPGYSATSGDGFVEGNADQYTWFVPYDPAGLFDALGGRDAARSRLDGFFAELNGGPKSPHAYLGNEPTLGTPWLYDWLGQPWKTQEIVRRAQTQLYQPTPGGMPGNDDGGTMSAWWVLAALGLYPTTPGEDVLALSSPMFRRATLRLGHGTLVVGAPAAGAGRPYVQSMTLNGRPWTKPWLRFGDVARGGRLNFALGASPNTSWGADPAAAPPSFAP